MMMHNDKELAACVLLATNAAWDVLCACAMLYAEYAVVDGDGPAWVGWLADAHWGLWATEADREHPVARLLFGTLTLQWGATRLIGACMVPYVPPVVVLSTYAIEGLLLIACACGGLMRPTRAFAAGLLSWAFLVALCVLIFV